MSGAIEIAVAVVGLALIVLAVRRGRSKGAAAGLQLAALGFILAGASAIGVVEFLAGIALSLTGWVGVGLLGIGGLLFFIGQALEGRRGGGTAKSGADDQPGAVPGQNAPPAVGRSKAKPAPGGGKKSAADDEFDDIEALLRKHGIE